MAVLFRHELLAKVRVELGLTQEDAARSVGVDVRTYRRYESGEVNEAGAFAVQRASRRRILERICRELGIEEAELLVPVDPRPARSAALPRARHFVGRESELTRLRVWLSEAAARARIVAVVAMGGAGKTSLVERALGGHEERVFVHSFYDEPSVDVFLAAAAAHLGEGAAEPLDGILAGMQRAPATVLVLDGLELLQADGEGERARGQLEDRRLLRLFRTVARSRAGRLLATSRFGLTDLSSHEGVELETLALEALSGSETRALLERWGARGSSSTFTMVHEQTGGHALSLTVIGSYASELLGSDLELATGLSLADAAREQPLARRLRGVLDKYAAELQPLERRLLVGVCLFPRGTSEAALAELPELGAPSAVGLRAALGRLVQRGLAVQQGERYSAHPFIREHFAAHEPDAVALHRKQRELLATDLAGQPLHRPTGAALLDRCERLFEHTLLAGDAAGAYRVLERTLGGFAHLGLRLGEFERGLRLVRALEPGAAELPGDVQWRIGYDRGLYAAALGDLESAVRSYRKLLAHRDDDATTHRTLAYTLRLQGALPQALEQVERSIALGRRDDAVGTTARGLALRGAILTSQGQLREAGEAFDEARALGDAPTARRAIWEAEYRLASGEVERAAAETAQNLAWCQQRGWAGHVAHCHLLLGRAALLRGLVGEAEDSLGAAEDWCLRSREAELTLEARLLELALARAAGDGTRADALVQPLMEAASAGGFGLILQAIDYGRA